MYNEAMDKPRASKMSLIERIKKQSKLFIDANVWDGEDRSGCNNDWVKHSPDDLQELVDDLIEHVLIKELEARDKILDDIDSRIGEGWTEGLAKALIKAGE